MKFDYDRDATYVVKSGDTLSEIAKNQNVSVKDIMKANDLKNALIYPNQVLVIPIKNNNGVYFVEYVVKTDDTLDKIAAKNNTTVDEISKYNDLNKLYLITDQTINIPTNYKVYTTVATDSLERILEKTGMALEELVMLNYNTLFKEGTKLMYK